MFRNDLEASWALRATGVLDGKATGRGVRVAVLDTGFDFKHPDFSARKIAARSFVGDNALDDDAFDQNGHGTHCTGVIAGPFIPKEPPRYGIAPDVELFVGKVLDERGHSEWSAVVAGLEWALDQNCDIILLPLGETEESRAEYEKIAAMALEEGVLVVAAVGNGSQRPGFVALPKSPANCPSVLAVGALTKRLQIAPFCNDGAQIWAPGVMVPSSWRHPRLTVLSGGTSVAAAVVAGVAALWAEQTGARGWELQKVMCQHATVLTEELRMVQAPR